MTGNKMRRVSDKDFDEAYNNIDNIKIMEFVCNKFGKLLDKEQRKECQMYGLWKALGYHIEGKGQKFTTNLYKFVRFECLMAINKNKRKFFSFKNPNYIIDNNNEFTKLEDNESLNHLLSNLTKKELKILDMRFYDRLNFGKIAKKLKISKFQASKRLHDAINKLKNVSKCS